jgi:hypothetical protein
MAQITSHCVPTQAHEAGTPCILFCLGSPLRAARQPQDFATVSFWHEAVLLRRMWLVAGYQHARRQHISGVQAQGLLGMLDIMGHG